MKKLLLLFFLALGFSGQSQSLYWETVATTFSTANTYITQLSYAGNSTDVIWGTGTISGNDTFNRWTRSTDGGSTWTNGAINFGNATLGVGSISAVSATTAYASAFPGTGSTALGGIFKTSDGGATWVKQPSASFNSGTSFANIVHFWPGGQVGFCQGDPVGGSFEIYTTTNGGENWTRVSAANIPVPLTDEYGYTRVLTVTGNTVWFGTNKGRLYRSTDFGNTWTVSATPLADFGSADESGIFAFSDNDNGIVISGNFAYHRTTDGGANWSTENPDTAYRNFDIAYVPGTANTFVSIGDDLLEGTGGSSYSTDGGTTWFDINVVDGDFAINPAFGLAFADSTHGIAGSVAASSTSQGAYKWIGTFLANVDFNSAKAFTASPNPTTGILDLVGKNISNVTVFDILGKQVSNTKYGAIDKVTLNLSSLNSGIYMVKIANNAGAVSTVKVVKQ